MGSPEPHSLCTYAGKTVLAVGAHPDDLELGIGGALARFSRAGARVVAAVACIPDHYETRRAEAEKGCAILGAELRVLINHGCAHVEDVKIYDLVRRIDALVNELKPAALFAHGAADFHNDHVMVHNACMASQRLKPLDFYCYPPTSCRPSAMNFEPQVYVDISQTLPVKMEAVRAHASQFGSRGLDVGFVVDVARALGRSVGVQYAEAMELVHMVLS